MEEDFPVLQIEDGQVLNVEEVFGEVPFLKGEMYSGTSWRDTKAIIPEESAFVWRDGKIYWGVVSIGQSRDAYGPNFIQLTPCAESLSKIVGIPSKYWRKSRSADNTYYRESIKNPV